MDVEGEEFLDVVRHGHATRMFGVVLVSIHTRKFGNLPVLSDGVVILEDVAEVKGMAFDDVFNA